MLAPLPIDASIPRMLAALRAQRSLVVVAPPGAGKTTRLPPAILEAGLLPREHPRLVLLQPRRVAARAVAMRIAEERGWALGEQVGYHVRFERRLTSATPLRVLTEGILNRQLLDDPALEGVGAVVLDEFHERSIHSDLAAGLLREVRQSLRPDLLLVVMSATLEAEPVAAFLGDCPVVRSEGRTYPIDVAYRPGTRETPLPRQIVSVLPEVLEREGDVLVFLPGAEEIRRTATALEPLAAARDLAVLPLHGSLTAEEQMLALRPADRRKVILATNIAETSLTIEGVRSVIDSGLERVAGYDPQRGMDRLELARISRASAEQRAGRAGRTAPGFCIRLWSKQQQAALEPFQRPEVERIDLSQAILSLHAWGQRDPRGFGWFTPPPEAHLAAAERLLAMLGALDQEKGSITLLGRRMLNLPVHPRIARLLLAAAELGLAAEGATLAALLSEKDIVRNEPHSPWRAPRTRAASDLLVRMELLESAAHDPSLDRAAVRRVLHVRQQFLQLVRKTPAATAPDESALLKLILLAYPDRVARRRANDPATAALVGGGAVRLADESVVRDAPFFLALDARDDDRSHNRQSLVRLASAIEPAWLEELFPAQIRRGRRVEFDPERRKVLAWRQTFYADLLLEETRDDRIDPADAGRVLAEALRPRAATIFQADPAAALLLARVAFLRRHMGEHPWPPFDDEQLAQLLADACAGRRGVDDLPGGTLANLLRGTLAYPLDRLLDEHAPEALQVPSGSRIRLDYSNPAAPVLAVRLQEIFGWTATPRLAGGRVAVLLHLLGPNFRPVQITDDLNSFWSTAYFQVRKDLRVRYPRHAWPDDPLTAAPQAKGGKRRT